MNEFINVTKSCCGTESSTELIDITSSNSIRFPSGPIIEPGRFPRTPERLQEVQKHPWAA